MKGFRRKKTIEEIALSKRPIVAPPYYPTTQAMQLYGNSLFDQDLQKAKLAQVNKIAAQQDRLDIQRQSAETGIPVAQIAATRAPAENPVGEAINAQNMKRLEGDSTVMARRLDEAAALDEREARRLENRRNVIPDLIPKAPPGVPMGAAQPSLIQIEEPTSTAQSSGYQQRSVRVPENPSVRELRVNQRVPPESPPGEFERSQLPLPEEVAREVEEFSTEIPADKMKEIDDVRNRMMGFYQNTENSISKAGLVHTEKLQKLKQLKVIKDEFLREMKPNYVKDKFARAIRAGNTPDQAFDIILEAGTKFNNRVRNVTQDIVTTGEPYRSSSRRSLALNPSVPK